MKRTHRTKGGYYYKAICDTLEILQSKKYEYNQAMNSLSNIINKK